MPLSAADQQRIDAFRQKIEQTLPTVLPCARAERDDRPDGAALASRFEVAPRLWIELVIRPAIPQLRAGIVTDDRWRNEELEEKIEESGDSMGEFIELGFDEAGLDWTNPTVEHYRDQGKYFVFSTGLELASLAELESPTTAEKARAMLGGYYHAFRPAIEKARAESGAA